MKLFMVVAGMLALPWAHAAALPDVSLQRRSTFTSDAAQKQAEADHREFVASDWLSTASPGESIIIGNSSFELLPSSEAHAPKGAGTKRCIYRTTKQVNVDRTGTWWDGWDKVSGCNYCGLSSGHCAYGINWSVTKTMSISFGLDAGSASSAEGTINGNAGLNLGFTWSKSTSDGGSWTCNVNANDVGSVWAQKRWGWADTASRICRSDTCYGDTVCSGWTFGHGNWPLKGGNGNLNLGCSTGANAHC